MPLPVDSYVCQPSLSHGPLTSAQTFVSLRHRLRPAALRVASFVLLATLPAMAQTPSPAAPPPPSTAAAATPAPNAATSQPATTGNPQPVDRTNLTARLLAARKSSRLDDRSDPTLKPWHLKLAVQLYDATGKPSEQATIEEWWSPDADKRTYTSPSYTATEIRHNGDLFRTTGQPTPPYLLELSRIQVVDPLLDADDLDETRPQLKPVTLGTVKLDCIVLARPIEHLAFPPLGLFPTYCIDPQSDVPRLSYEYANQMIGRNRGGIFQARTIALDNRITIGTMVAATTQTVSLNTWFVDPSSLEPGSALAQIATGTVAVSPDDVTALAIKKVPPVYPVSAKQRHITGRVILQGTIGTDGHIHRLEVVSAPDASLALASLAAVMQWQYKPYLSKGRPSEVSSKIMVNFDMNFNIR